MNPEKECCVINTDELTKEQLHIFACFNLCVNNDNQAGAIDFALKFYKANIDAFQTIQNIVKELAKLNIGVLITDHNVRETLAICDRAYVLKDGTLLASGNSAEVAENKLVKTYYLGEDFRF